MSGIYIPMEMPKSCHECVFGKYEVCQINLAINGKDPPFCPLIPVPDHGDLIDRGYAIASACSGRIRTLPTTEDGEDWIRVDEVRDSIKSVPTVIPADKEGGV